MIAFPATLRQLRDAIDSMIEATGSENTPVVSRRSPGSTEIDWPLNVELVYANGLGVVGTEADGYRPDPGNGDVKAVLIW